MNLVKPWSRTELQRSCCCNKSSLEYQRRGESISHNLLSVNRGALRGLKTGLMRLSGKVAVVTGAAVGLGRAVAGRYAREGAAVVWRIRTFPAGPLRSRKSAKRGDVESSFAADVGEERDVTAVFNQPAPNSDGSMCSTIMRLSSCTAVMSERTN